MNSPLRDTSPLQETSSRRTASPHGASLSRRAVLSVLEAFAVGDALGMPTEFMTRREISGRFDLVDRLLEPEESKNHPDLHRGQVTDDTEQVLALLDEYCQKGRIDPRETAGRLLRWMRESGALEKRYIGPSSKIALEAIGAGADPATTGQGGTTCGGVMRSPAAALFALSRGLPLEASIRACLLATHNTQPALEAATAYAYALREALAGGDLAGIAAAAVRGCGAGISLAPYERCGASLAARIGHFISIAPGFRKPDEVLDFLYGVYGTGLESVDVASAAICIFLYAARDTWLCLRMGASLGGDTDTVAALAGALSAAHCASRGEGHFIPAEILDEVVKGNGLDLQALVAGLIPEESADFGDRAGGKRFRP